MKREDVKPGMTVRIRWSEKLFQQTDARPFIGKECKVIEVPKCEQDVDFLVELNCNSRPQRLFAAPDLVGVVGVESVATDSEQVGLHVWVRALMHHGQRGAESDQPQGWHLVNGRLVHDDGREFELVFRRMK